VLQVNDTGQRDEDSMEDAWAGQEGNIGHWMKQTKSGDQLGIAIKIKQNRLNEVCWIAGGRSND